MMKKLRVPSPALSENEYDISASLFANGNENHGRLSESEDQDRLDKGNRTGSKSIEQNVYAEDLGLDDEAIIAEQQAASNRKSGNLKGRTVKKGGGFQAMGLAPALLKAITRKGFSVPTPIQRKTVPLLLNEKDVVGMARTGSGKTAAFVIPMIEKLKLHSTMMGARALILSPSRELALQTLQVVKELGRGTDLRTILLVGGDSLEDQFSSMTGNPDIIIATPGRFLHLKVEMGLDLSSIRYVVFDEADRLFEMGFAAQLTEILHALPPSRQTALFSATLPRSLVEFARAGLQDPILVRLDAETKISPDLQSAFFTVKSSEKEGALLHILQDIIHVPMKSQLISATPSTPKQASKQEPNSLKRKRNENETISNELSRQFSTIVFAATKHSVDYLSYLLKLAGYAVSYTYGSLDQTARKMQVEDFRSGQTNILVVTDVAARGIDIPILANVINYDFPSQPKVFVHRVGRTARAGQKGWSYSIIRYADAPYLLDLQLFLGRRLLIGREGVEKANFTSDVVVGGFHRENVQNNGEWVVTTLETDADLAAMRSVAVKGEKLYQRTRSSASAESAKRARDLVASHAWTDLHPLFNDQSDNMELEREKMLAKVGGFRPQESIFEIGTRRGGRKGNEEAIEAIRKIRSGLDSRKRKSTATNEVKNSNNHEKIADINTPAEGDDSEENHDLMSIASESELEVTFSGNGKNRPRKSESTTSNAAESYRDTEHFMSYTPANNSIVEDRAYAVHAGDGSNFTEAARGAAMDLDQDEGSRGFGEAQGVMRWDKRHKKYVGRRNDEDGSKGKKLVRGESGAKIAASFRSGRYDAWRKANRINGLPRVGDSEARISRPDDKMGKRYRHVSTKAPKPADKYRDDFDKRKKKVAEAKIRQAGQQGTSELRSVDDIHKNRRLKEKRREKNARPTRKTRR